MRAHHLVASCAALTVALPIPLLVGNYWTGVFTSVAIYCIVGVGLNLVMGYAGQFSLAATAFFAIGAYVSALAVTRLDIPFWPALLIGGLGAGAFGLVVGWASLRLAGIYFAIATFVAVELVATMLVYLRSLTGGPDGLIVDYAPFADLRGYYYLAVAVVLLELGFVLLLVRSRSGRALAAIRQDELAARSVGIQTTRYKLQAFLATGIFSGIAGGIITPYLSYISPSMFDTDATLKFLAIAIIGGLGTFTGPIVGSLIVIGMPEAFSITGDAEVFMFGVAIIVIILLLPKGVVGSLARLGGHRRAHEGAPPIARAVDAHVRPPRPRADVPPGAEGQPILQVKGVSKAYRGVHALQDVDVEVRTGEMLGLIGPNGAGKTTLFDVVTGLTPYDAGTVLLAGGPIAGLRPEALARKGLVRTFQLTRVFSDLTVRENLLTACHGLGDGGMLADIARTGPTRRSEARLREAADEAIEFFGLTDYAGVVASNLPYGRGRVLGVALAAMCGPRLLLLDEPAAGLNPDENGELAEIIRRLNREGTTIWVVEHNMTFLMSLVDRIVVLAQGRKIADASPRAVQDDPEVASVYLGHHATAH